MVLESIVIALVSMYIAIVAFGHVLLVTALLRWVREDWLVGRRQPPASLPQGNEPSVGAVIARGTWPIG